MEDTVQPTDVPSVPPLPDFLSAEVAADPYAYYRNLREQAPLLWHEASGTYLVSRHDDLVRVLRDPAFTTDHYAQSMEPVYGRTIIQMNGHEHAVRRALVTPAFKGSLFQERYASVIERTARTLIDGFRHRGSVDLVTEFARVFPVDVISRMLGFDHADAPKFRTWYRAIVTCFGNLTGDPEIAALGVRTRAEMTEYMVPVIEDRRRNPREDLLSDLCAATADGEAMDTEDIRAFTALLLVAGGETTDKALGLVFRNLLAHPDQLDAVRRDPGLVGAALAETLRLTPPVQVIQRLASEEAELSGGTVPAGSLVTCLIASANRDPRKFADPERFDIFREDLAVKKAFTAASDHLAFSLGRHFCLGAALSLAEVSTAVPMLLDAMPDMRLAPGAEPAEEGLFVRGLDSLPLEFSAGE